MILREAIDEINRLIATDGITCEYCRGNVSTKLRALIGSHSNDTILESGITLSQQTITVIMRSDDLRLHGVKVVPEAGDRLVITSKNDTIEYEVVSLGGSGCWRYYDPLGSLISVNIQGIG